MDNVVDVISSVECVKLSLVLQTHFINSVWRLAMCLQVPVLTPFMSKMQLFYFG